MGRDDRTARTYLSPALQKAAHPSKPLTHTCPAVKPTRRTARTAPHCSPHLCDGRAALDMHVRAHHRCCTRVPSTRWAGGRSAALDLKITSRLRQGSPAWSLPAAHAAARAQPYQNLPASPRQAQPRYQPATATTPEVSVLHWELGSGWVHAGPDLGVASWELGCDVGEAEQDWHQAGC